MFQLGNQLSRVRGLASGISSAFDFVLRFICTKTYYNLETSLSLPGISLFNCIIVGVGIILMYQIMPETEGRTLEDIEMHFSDNSKKITDRNIVKMNATEQNGGQRSVEETSFENDDNYLKYNTKL